MTKYDNFFVYVSMSISGNEANTRHNFMNNKGLEV